MIDKIIFISTVTIILFSSCKSVANVNKYYNEGYVKYYDDCYFHEYIKLENIEHNTFRTIYIPNIKGEFQLNEKFNPGDTVRHENLFQIKYYELMKLDHYSNRYAYKNLEHAKDLQKVTIARRYFEDELEGLTGDLGDLKIAERRKEHFIYAIMNDSLETSKDYNKLIVELYKGDSISKTNRYKVICPLNITSKIKYELCRKLDPENKEICVDRKYNEHLKDLVEDYQIIEMNFMYEILLEETLDKLNIDYR